MVLHSYKKFLLTPLVTADVKVALLTDAYEVTGDEEFFSEVNAQELAATGYIMGGQDLANKSVQETDLLAYFKSDNPSWNITGTANVRHACFYINTGVASTSRIISIYTFPVLRTVINDSLTLEIPSSGILSIQ